MQKTSFSERKFWKDLELSIISFSSEKTFLATDSLKLMVAS